jgi:hypothetical protein
MSKEFAKQVVEHYDELRSTMILEDEQTTNDTLALQIPKYNRAMITKALAELIATNFYEVGTMMGPIEKTPVEMYNREAGVTTTEVVEGGQIKTGKTSYSSVTLEAVGFKLRAQLTAEAIEDAQNAGNINIIARAIAYLGKDIAEEIDTKLMQLMVDGAAAGNVDVAKGALTGKAYGDSIVSGIVDAIQFVKLKNYRPDFLLIDPNVFGYLAKTDEFVHADKYGPTTGTTLQQTGYLGRIRGLDVFESNNMPLNKAVIGKRQIFGVYKVYIPLMLRGPLYNTDLDKETYVVRQRCAMKVTLGEALATVSLVA